MIEGKVSIVRTQGELFESLKKGIEMIKDFDLRENDLIVIKPNLSDLNADAVTKRDIVECLIRYIRNETNAPIKIIESDHWISSADSEFKYFGYDMLPKIYNNVESINISKKKKIRIMMEGKFFKTLDVPEILLKATKFISVARLKTHMQYKMTCILKNQYGLISNKYKSKYHPFMNEVLFDINNFIKPCLCIVDAREVMEGYGPSSGRIRKMDLILVGNQSEAVDYIAAKIIGFNPSSIPYLKYSLRRKNVSKPDIELIGENLETIKQKLDFVPSTSYLLMRLVFRIQRISVHLKNLLDKLANFFSLSSLACFLLNRMELETLEYGLLKKRIIWAYVKGAISRFSIGLKLKIQRIA